MGRRKMEKLGILERWLFLAGSLILLGLGGIVLIDDFLRRFFHLVEKLQELLAILRLGKGVAHRFEIGIEEIAKNCGEFLEIGDDETLAIDEDPQGGAHPHDHNKVADAAVGNEVAALQPGGFFFVCDFFHSVFDVLSPQVLVFERGYFEGFHDGQALILGQFLSVLYQMLYVDVLAVLEYRRQEGNGDGTAEDTGTGGKKGSGTCGDVDGEDELVGDFGVLLDGGVEDLVGSVVGKEIGQGLPWLIVGR